MKSPESKACTPIEKAIVIIRSENISIIKLEIRDYHFLELIVEVEKITDSLNEKLLNIEGIESKDGKSYYCTCHWSTIIESKN